MNAIDCNIPTICKEVTCMQIPMKTKISLKIIFLKDYSALYKL
jgi:hypothetical protein